MERGYGARRSARKRKTSSSYTDYQIEDDEPLQSKRTRKISLPFHEVKDNCQKILTNLMEHKYGWPFNQPVDPIALEIPDYLEKIKTPMDLGTIQKKIHASEYAFTEEFAADVRLVFSNCCTYNLADSDIYVMATSLSAIFEKQFKAMFRTKGTKPQKQDEIAEMQSVIAELRNEHQKLLNELSKLVKTGQNAERSNTQPATPKPRKPRVKKEKVKVEMEIFTVKQKADLTLKIGKLSPEDLQKMVELLSTEVDQKDGELEIDLEKLSVPTLKKLDAFVNNCLQAEGKSIDGSLPGQNNEDESSSSSDSDSSSSDSSDSESEQEKQDPSGGKANDAST